jgi:dipeptidyl aminopeptidase/acylaminoacyl peptidase
MTTFDRFERSIPDLMTELAPARVPDYFDDMLRTTATHRQRPAWSYPERWLPMEITARSLAMRALPWRPLAILALIALLVAAGLAVYVGSQTRIPPPFGLAGNGVLLYRATDGSIVTIDPIAGSRTTLAAAGAGLGEPIPSRDGRHVAFIPRQPLSAAVRGAAIDGSNRTIISGTYANIMGVDWSPDGTELAFISELGGFGSVTVAMTDGSGDTTLPIDRDVWQIHYLPDGRLAVIAAERVGACPVEAPPSSSCALFVVNHDGSGLDLLVPADHFNGINTIDASPDGTKLLWVEWKSGSEGRLHVFDRTTRIDRRLDDAGFPTPYAINRAWFSPDGTSILFDLFEADGDHWAVVPAAGGTPVRIGKKMPDHGSDAEWAPDGRSVLARYATSDTSGELWLLDPTGTGADRRLDIEVPYLPSWQRIAPSR